jgi:hypothetical protein
MSTSPIKHLDDKEISLFKSRNNLQEYLDNTKYATDEESDVANFNNTGIQIPNTLTGGGKTKKINTRKRTNRKKKSRKSIKRNKSYNKKPKKTIKRKKSRKLSRRRMR